VASGSAPDGEPIEVLQLRLRLERFRKHGDVEDISKPTKAFDKLLTSRQRAQMAKRVAELDATRKAYWKRSGYREDANRKSHFYEQRKRDAEELLSAWCATRHDRKDLHLLYLRAYRAALQAWAFFHRLVPKQEQDAYTVPDGYPAHLLPETAEEAIDWLPFYDQERGRAEYLACENPSKIAAIEALEQLIAERLKAAREVGSDGTTSN
jgi:hypothetical protein